MPRRRDTAADGRAAWLVACVDVAVLILAGLAPPARAESPSLPPAIHGNESVAASDDATALFVNPAAIGWRYPSELMLSWSERDPGAQHLARGALSLGGFGLAGVHAEDGPNRFSLGFAGGRAERFGMRFDALRSAGGGARATDLAIGTLSRPAPWVSWGATIEHVAQPHFMGSALRREYVLGLGFRPLALSRTAAFTYGPRLTFTADLALREGSPNEAARVRVGGALEIVPGLVLRGAFEDHGGVQAGIALLGARGGYHTQASYDAGGKRVAQTHSISMHDAEDRSVLEARPGRVAIVRVSGALADEHLGGTGLLESGGGSPTRRVHAALDRAVHDPRTRGVLIEARGVSGMAQVEELRPRIRRLRAAGKPVVAYLEYGAGRAGLMLASACDRVVTTPGAYYRGLGLRIEQRYYRSLLERWGVKLERSSFGQYKSAYRNYSVDSTTAADREVFENVLDVHERLFVDAVTADRGITRERLMPIIDGRDWPAEELQQAGLVDSLGYREDALRILGRMSGLGPEPPQVNLAKIPEPQRAWHVPARVAVVFASGGMDLGESGNDLLFGPTMGARTVTRQIEAAFRNPEVEAVVLRIESPGGVTLASDLIHHAVERMKRETKKPLIVSMGSSAASGGYHMASPADWILADRFTYTGSIGVFFVKPSFEGLYANWGVRQEAFERGRYMRGLSPARDWGPEIQAIADSATYREYRDFVADVAHGRHMSIAAVDSVAQGRVWMGEDALSRGLIDAIGTLEDAIGEARRRAGIPAGEKIRIAEYRRPNGGFLERFVQSRIDDFVRSNLRLPDPGTTFHWADLPRVE